MPANDPPVAHTPPSRLADASDEELKGRLKRTERDLYWSRHEDRGASPENLEREWNDLKAEQARRRKKTWQYKYDRRNGFTLESKPSEDAQGHLRTTTTVAGQAHDPDSTIRWRSDTQYGANRYKQIQRNAKRNGWIEDGHDLGHLAADEHGVDPEGVNAGQVNSRTRVGSVERPNYTSQGGRTNEHAGWRSEEAKITEASRTAPVDYTITSVATDKRGLHREQSRTMGATQTVNGEVHTLSSDTVAHAGFADHIKARERAARTGSKPSGHENQVETLKAKVQSQTTDQMAPRPPGITSTPTPAPKTEQLREKSEQLTQAKTKSKSKPKLTQ